MEVGAQEIVEAIGQEGFAADAYGLTVQAFEGADIALEEGAGGFEAVGKLYTSYNAHIDLI